MNKLVIAGATGFIALTAIVGVAGGANAATLSSSTSTPAHAKATVASVQATSATRTSKLIERDQRWSRISTRRLPWEGASVVAMEEPSGCTATEVERARTLKFSSTTVMRGVPGNIPWTLISCTPVEV